MERINYVHIILGISCVLLLIAFSVYYKSYNINIQMGENKYIEEIKNSIDDNKIKLTNIETRLNEYVRDYRNDIHNILERIHRLESNNYQVSVEITENNNKTYQKFLTLDTFIRSLDNKIKRIENNITNPKTV